MQGKSRQAAERASGRAARVQETSSASELVAEAAVRNTDDAREMARVVARLHERIEETNRINRPDVQNP